MGGEQISNGFPLERGGFDWLECALYGTWQRGGVPIEVDPDGPPLENFLEPAAWRAFDQLKTKAEQEEAPQLWELPDGSPAIMQSHGAQLGYGGARWVFDVHGIRFMVTARDGIDRPALTFRATSLTLMILGAETVWATVLNVLGQLGFAYTKSATPSRVDVCIDQRGAATIDAATSAAMRKAVIKLLKTPQLQLNDAFEPTGLRMGNRSSCFLQIYDKAEELRAKPGPESEDKRSILECCRWGGPQEQATRVEFTFAGSWLRENFGVTSMESLFARLANVVAQVCTKWVRFLQSAVDRDNNNHQRAITAAWWEAVVSDFLAWIDAPTEDVQRPLKKGISNLMLFKQVKGCLTTLLAQQAREFGTPGEAWAYFARTVLMDMPELFNVIQQKRLARAAVSLSLKEAS